MVMESKSKCFPRACVCTVYALKLFISVTVDNNI